MANRPSAHRAKQIERRIRQLRSHPDLWSDDAAKSERVTRLIIRHKARMASTWALRTVHDWRLSAYA